MSEQSVDKTEIILQELGRKNRANNANIAKFLAALAAGSTKKIAAQFAGLGTSTVREWELESPALKEEIARMKSKSAVMALSHVQKAMKNDGRLAYRFYKDKVTEIDPASTGTDIPLSIPVLIAEAKPQMGSLQELDVTDVSPTVNSHEQTTGEMGGRPKKVEELTDEEKALNSINFNS